MTSDMPDVVEVRWKKTSAPAVVEDKRRGTWCLTLRYTASTKCRTIKKYSRSFKTREEAVASDLVETQLGARPQGRADRPAN